MPTYGYQCTRCDNAFEIVQKITDAPLAACDRCGAELRKKIFPVGIQFKGSGFYVNDYAPKGKSAAEPASSEPKAADETKSEPAPAAPAAAPAAESKPAAAAATSAPAAKSD